MARMKSVAAALLAGGLLFSLPAHAQSPEAKAQLTKMITAVEKGDYDSFVENAEPVFKAALPKTQFDSGTVKIYVRMKSGYTTSYLGTLNKGGFSVSYWKLAFKDGKDDVLVTMALKDGRVGGFSMN